MFSEEEILQIQDEENEGCGYCIDRRHRKEIELFFLDAANNMRVCHYCPWCGRPYNEKEDNY